MTAPAIESLFRLDNNSLRGSLSIRTISSYICWSNQSMDQRMKSWRYSSRCSVLSSLRYDSDARALALYHNPSNCASHADSSAQRNSHARAEHSCEHWARTIGQRPDRIEEPFDGGALDRAHSLRRRLLSNVGVRSRCQIGVTLEEHYGAVLVSEFFLGIPALLPDHVVSHHENIDSTVRERLPRVRQDSPQSALRAG